MELKMSSKSETQKKIIVLSHKTTFNDLLKATNIQDTSAPMRKFTNDEEDELDLTNPYSTITCFILYMYSLEFGSPPLYAELNRVVRTMDLTQIENLGPLARALNVITGCAENKKSVDDKILTGEQIFNKKKGVFKNMAGVFFLWRGL